MEINEIQDLLRNSSTIAVYGFSRNSEKLAHSIPVFLRSRGYNIVGINPQPFEVEGIKVYQRLIDIPDKIDILDVFRPSEYCFDVAKEAVERRQKRGDIKVLWLQEGIINNEAKSLAEENGIIFIQDICIFKIYNSL